MTFNDTAAAYGLFQVVFADVAEHLAVATFCLQRRKEPSLVFEKVFRREFQNNIGQLRDELKPFQDRSPVAENVRELRAACDVMSDLGVWRRDRIHARIRMRDAGFALYNCRTGRRLEINEDEIARKISRS